MSKSNNVNPGQYKVAGRLRQDDMAQARATALRSQNPKRGAKAKSAGTAARRSKSLNRTSR